MQGQAGALRGRGEDLSAAIGALEPFADEATRLLRVLDTQEQAVTKFVSDGGEVFGALSERQGQLQGLIRASNAVFGTTAATERGAGRGVHDLPDLPPRVADDPDEARGVRRGHRPGRDRAEADRRGARADRQGARGPRAERALVLPGAAGDDQGRPGRHTRRPGACSTTTCRRSSASSTTGSGR